MTLDDFIRLVPPRRYAVASWKRGSCLCPMATVIAATDGDFDYTRDEAINISRAAHILDVHEDWVKGFNIGWDCPSFLSVEDSIVTIADRTLYMESPQFLAGTVVGYELNLHPDYQNVKGRRG